MVHFAKHRQDTTVLTAARIAGAVAVCKEGIPAGDPRASPALAPIPLYDVTTPTPRDFRLSPLSLP